MTLHCSSSFFVAAAAFGALACSSSDKCIPLPLEAPIAYEPAVMIGVSDSISGKPIADSAGGTIHSSTSASDSLRHWYPPDSVLIGDLGPGWFTVTVQRPGYLTWVRKNVIVKSNACGGAVTTNLSARLQRGP